MTRDERRTRRIPPKTAEQASAKLGLDLVGVAEAAELAGIGRAAFSLRRQQHPNFPEPVADLRCGPIWFRWQIQSYLAEEQWLGPCGWYGRRLPPRKVAALVRAHTESVLGRTQARSLPLVNRAVDLAPAAQA